MTVIVSRLLHGACVAAVLAILFAVCSTSASEPAKPGRQAGGGAPQAGGGAHATSSFRFPTVPPEHKHVRALLENALRYAAPANKMIDPVSGYPFEGWNQD